jgi:putative sigma-54 modulation protein
LFRHINYRRPAWITTENAVLMPSGFDKEAFMNVDIRAVHFDLGEPSRDYLNKKLERLDYAKDLIIDLLFAFTKEKQFQCECTINFRWGTSAHVQETDFDLAAGIDKLMDVLEHKITKEKNKQQEKK